MNARLRNNVGFLKTSDFSRDKRTRILFGNMFVRELVREHVLVRERKQNTNKNFVAFREQEQNENKNISNTENENKNQKNTFTLIPWTSVHKLFVSLFSMYDQKS